MSIFITILLMAVIIGSIVLIIVNFIKLVKVKNELFGKAEVRRAAKRAAEKIKLKDPVITCDYCGCKIDTHKDKVCPNCGGPYDKDKEWLKRHDLDEKTIDKTTKSAFADLGSTIKERKAPALKSARIKLLLSFIPFVLIVFFITISLIIANRKITRRTEELNVNSYDHFTEADYKIEGDGIIYNDGDVTISVTGFFVDGFQRKNELFGNEGEVKVGIKVENNRKERIQVTMTCYSLNGVTRSYQGFYLYDWFDKESTTTFYEQFYGIPTQTISELVITNLSVNDSKYTYNRNASKPITIKTDSDFSMAPSFEGQEPIFTNDLADIYCSYKEKYERYELCVVNKTDIYFKIEDQLTYKEGTPTQSLYIYNDIVPAGYTFVSGNTDLFMGDPDAEEVYISLMLVYPDDPAKSFSTGFMKIKNEKK